MYFNEHWKTISFILFVSFISINFIKNNNYENFNQKNDKRRPKDCTKFFKRLSGRIKKN